MSITKSLGKMAEIGLGVYLVMPSIEDAATGGITLIPSAVVGLGLIAHGFGMKMPKFY